MKPTKEQLITMLIKYSIHVGSHEGIDFLDDGYEADVFTDEEWKYMRKITGK